MENLSGAGRAERQGAAACSHQDSAVTPGWSLPRRLTASGSRLAQSNVLALSYYPIALQWSFKVVIQPATRCVQ